MEQILVNDRWPLWVPPHRVNAVPWETWEKARLQAMYNTLFQGLTVYDVGTEEGDMSALLARWVGPGGNVHLFEPGRKVWRNIRAIWEANEVTPSGCFAGFAANETAGAMEPGPGWPICAEGEPEDCHGFAFLDERPDIQRVKLDDYADFCGDAPNVLNIDVEGSELEVLKGAKYILTRHRPVVFVSVHPAFMVAHHEHHDQDLFRFMWDLGYLHEVLDYDHEWHVRFHP